MIEITKYKKEYTVKSYEADSHGFLRLLSLMNFLQDIADENATHLGLGFEDCWQKGVSWVGTNYVIEIYRLPKIHEKFIIETWPAEAKIWGAIRDFIITDILGNIIVKVSSQWVLIDINRKKPVMLNKYFPNYIAINERVIKTDFPKLPEIEQISTSRDFMIRFDDIDVNQHVNNAIYPIWACESVDSQFRLNHTIKNISINFKKEALYGEVVQVDVQYISNKTIHSIKNKLDGTELARCEIDWNLITL